MYISCSDLGKSDLVELCEKRQEIRLEIVKTPDDYNSVRKRHTAVVDGTTLQQPSAEKLERKK